MGIPSAEEQIRFLRDIQALLEDGQFTATYKFALLIALSDLAVESGAIDDRELPVSIEDIARKFIEYYWQQSSPFIGREAAQILVQNTGRQAAVVNELIRLRREGISSLAQLRADSEASRQAVRKIARIVREMPLFKLQFVGGALRPFLYPQQTIEGGIQLNRGVAYHLRQFHTLITGLARDRWVAMVRQLRDNLYLVGQAQDLEVFLFGAGREPIRQHLDVLLDSQQGRCLYCRLDLPKANAHVDHFVPWMLHRCDALPNLVAAHSDCNLAKRDWLAAEPHLERWAERNQLRTQLSSSSTPGLAQPQWDRVNSITLWAYDRAFELTLPTWIRGREVQPLSMDYKRLFTT